MTKMERAKRIWTHVTALSSERGFYEYVNSGRALVVYSEGWFARIHTIFNQARGCHYPWRLRAQERLRHLPNRMGLWLSPGPKVLTVEWLEDEFRLVSMKRGDWEAELFQLEPYEGTGGLKPYELFSRRSKRW